MLFSCLWSQLGNVDSNNVNDLPTYLHSEKVSLIFFKFTNMSLGNINISLFVKKKGEKKIKWKKIQVSKLGVFLQKKKS